MVLTVHHLSVSQSERIPWLLEELALPYELIVHKRNPENHMGTPAIKSLPGNITGSAPVLIDSTASPSVTLAESGAIIQYILGRYAPDSPLNPQPQDADFASFCDWMHRANGSVMPAAMADLYMNYAKVGADVPIRLRLRDRFFKLAAHADEVLSKGKWICGERFTAADCMLHFAFAGSRFFVPFSLAEYPNILRWTRDCAARPAFQTAFKKGDPEILPMMPLGVESPTEADRPWTKAA